MPIANSRREKMEKTVSSRVTVETLIAELEEVRELARNVGDKCTEARAQRLSKQFRTQLRLKDC